ncbi:MAG: hypothetical protein KC487_01470 [Anaerolineae bacterium]|nr:hypothetical protein [Anaerolineae bacterium]
MTDRQEAGIVPVLTPSQLTQDEPLYVANDLVFRQAAPQGFGDRQNSWAWSMYWWKGKLYVGTNRAWHCAEHAGLNSAFPLFIKYPPKDPDAQCTPDPTELPLRAEIWCWTPGKDSWERLYQSPQDVSIPGKSGKLTAHEVGFRYMAEFTEPDGTEALYVSSVNARFIFRPFPSPRILRSVDGKTFEPLPQDPGTFMGTLDKCSFRTLVVYKDRLFVHVGSVRGEGIILESADPARGNDSFRQISPKDMRAFEMVTYNGYLYVGLRDPKKGYSVCKTDATGSAPYQFTTVVEPGAFAANPSFSVISMFVFQDRLFVGTDRPGEVIRINPDDTWDLVCGAPRETPDGWKYPLSGLDTGFGNWLNAHIWRMNEYNGRLYIGTWNMATDFRRVADADAYLRPHYGFDLFETTDGWHFTPVTTNGFGDIYSNGVRSFASTPHGLFVGTANKWQGLRVWQGIERTDTSEPDQPPHAPLRLEAETADNRVVLSWDDPAATGRYRVYRAQVTNIRDQVMSNSFMTRMMRIMKTLLFFMPDLYVPPVPDELWVPGDYEEIAETDQWFWIDSSVSPGARYQYLVRAVNDKRSLSPDSNIVSAPYLSPPVTFDSLLKQATTLPAAPKRMTTDSVGEAKRKIDDSDTPGALAQLEDLAGELADYSPDQPGWPLVDDVRVLIAKLQRRVMLHQSGVLSQEIL